MIRITEELVRKRSEHNELDILSLEELSLHQEDIGKLEHLQHWCRDLKILLLQNNLIYKIENVGKLKKLEYLNLSINNIEKIENLERCESLQKLDLTLNFIGDLLSVENLSKNEFLTELILMGNPCTEFTGYRPFVLATLPQLKVLDGEDILPSDRILARQNYDKIRQQIIIEQNRYFEKRKIQKKEKEQNLILSEDKVSGEFTEEQLENFWKSPSEHTPEDRLQLAVMTKKSKQRQNCEVVDPSLPPKREVRFFDKDGRPFNINQGKIPFHLEEDYYENCYKLDLEVYRYLDTNLIDVDIQPNYVRVLVKKKVFQLCLFEEVAPDKSTACRSQTTGHLLITMPKVKGIILTRPAKEAIENKKNKRKDEEKDKTKNREFLEFDETKLLNISKMLDIVNKKEEFMDDPEVPPLE